MTDLQVGANIATIVNVIIAVISFISGFYFRNIVAVFKTKINTKKQETIIINKTEGGEIEINKAEKGMIINANIVNLNLTDTAKEVKKDE